MPLIPALTLAQRRRLDAIVAAKRDQFAALSRPLTNASLRAILARERVALVIRPHPREAEILPILGRWTLILDARQSWRARLVFAAHEIAHYWMHVDPSEPHAYDRSPEWYDAVREAEAEYVAEQLLAGPVSPALPAERRRGNTRRTRTIEPISAPGWLEEVERDSDAVRLRDVAITAAREDASRIPPPAPGPTVRFVVPREQWSAVELYRIANETGAPYPHYSNIYTAPHHEYVTCTLPAARAVVEWLARAGYKRTAVHVRRIVRDAEARL